MDDNKKPPNRRPFATGSKPGPDELDHFLEEQGFYRKHVARDASSLFRVVSEQVFDIQNYHDKVRQDCATYMELHIKDYANEVDKNFYNYLSNLRRSRTYGTLLELRVIARMYKRNIVLFEPNQNFEAISRDFINDEEYSDREPIRVFYSHKDKHFDTIYTMSTVERLAECQAIIYEILYSRVFKLPDVKYAIERMLHDQEEQYTLALEGDPLKYKIANGEVYTFDSHEDTNCVLKDPRTCHFHNQVDFEDVVNENKDAITIINRSDDPGRLKIFKPIDGFLYKKDKSCVRQLLDEKITPFPYKVAKALDPSIYRNTEFELWSENRKEQRMKWFDSNGLPLKENDDRYWPYCGENDKLRRMDPFAIHKHPFDAPIIGEDPYITLDEDGKKKYIYPYDDYKLGHLTSLEHFQPPKGALDQFVMPVNIYHQQRNYRNNNRRNRGFHHNNNYHHGHHNQHHMNYVGDIERDNFHGNEQEQMYQPMTQPPPPIYPEMSANYQYYQYEQNSPPNPVYQNPPPSQYQYIPPTPYPQPVSAFPYQGQVFPYAYPQPTTLISYPAQPQSTAANVSNNSNETRDSSLRDPFNLVRDPEMGSAAINWNAKESVDSNGSDLPLNDTATLQFYYNIGVRYLNSSGMNISGNLSRRQESLTGHFETLDLNRASESHEPPPVPVNTPVSTKPPGNNGSGQSGHRYHQNNTRRVFQNQNSQAGGSKDSNKPRPQQQRKEIQFNSNVKNVHKVDQNKTVSSQSSAQNSSANIGHGTSASSLERVSSTLGPTTSSGMMTNLQISPATQEYQVEQQLQPSTPMSVQAQPQYYQQLSIPQSTQPIYCYQTENGDLMPLTQTVQPVYYGYSAPQTPLYYQPQQPHILDGTMGSSDSGIVDVSAFAYAQQQTYPIIYQQPTPIYYPQTPLITTPQLAPVFAYNNQQPAVIQHDLGANETVLGGLNEPSNTTNQQH